MDLENRIRNQARTQRVPENNPRIRQFVFSILGITLLGMSQWANASESEFGLTGVSLGASLPTPLGVNYQTLERNLPFGIQAETWTDTGWMNSTLKIHTALNYDSFEVRNFNSAKVQAFTLFAGVQAFSGKYGSQFSAFFGVDIGLMYDWMTFSNASNAVANTGMAFATQLVPGFDLPVSKRLGVVVEMPVRFIFVKTTWVMFSPALSLRFSLEGI